MDSKYIQQFKKGSLEMILLCLIAEKETYGYEIITKLNENGAAVLGYAREGTVYPILRRLTKDGYFATYLVESDSGPARKYYTMTDRGRIYLKKNILDWEEIMLLVNSILKGEGNDEQK